MDSIVQEMNGKSTTFVRHWKQPLLARNGDWAEPKTKARLPSIWFNRVWSLTGASHVYTVACEPHGTIWKGTQSWARRQAPTTWTLRFRTSGCSHAQRSIGNAQSSNHAVESSGSMVRMAGYGPPNGAEPDARDPKWYAISSSEHKFPCTFNKAKRSADLTNCCRRGLSLCASSTRGTARRTKLTPGPKRHTAPSLLVVRNGLHYLTGHSTRGPWNGWGNPLLRVLKGWHENPAARIAALSHSSRGQQTHSDLQCHPPHVEQKNGLHGVQSYVDSHL